MNVFLVIREDIHQLTSNRFVAWVLLKLGILNQTQATYVLGVHSTALEAMCMVSGLMARQVIQEKAKLIRSTEYAESQTIIKDIVLIWQDGITRTIYTVVQEPLMFPSHVHDFKSIAACVHCKERPR